ncbi:MAG: glycoside hydrolase family 88 protein [Prolixibacteraceae bacterium]|nr:glycoside hydrolase family 88 protein [Prolixibacteraceae bacterium]
MEHRFGSDKTNSFIKLKTYCERENFKGWDPYDGLNSRVFRATPLKHWSIARLAWIQAFKRNPVNLRKILMVPKGLNSKGVGLFLTGYTNLYQLARSGDNTFGTKQEIEKQINVLATSLINIQAKGYSGACWGYNFDWQNRVFFQPGNTPTVVATSFCADALFNAYEVTGNKKYLETALSAAKFVINDLSRTEKGENFLFSYSPLDQSQVYNASLLGARLLARCYHYIKNEEYKVLSRKVVNACIEVQNQDGSWVYGAANNQQWIDSFHTGFNLECIWEYMQYTGDFSAMEAFEKGTTFYLENFFQRDGKAKYYHNRVYPIDIHSPAQLIVTMAKINRMQLNKELTDRVLDWTLNNMQDSKGYFYYQIKQGISSKIPYMRWAQAWMFYAFSYYFQKTK